MPHQHDSCGHETPEDDHNHDSSDGFKDNLFSSIDRSNVVALNSENNAPDIIKSWHERLNETKYLESDADDQIIIRIPFTDSVRLTSLLLKSGPGDQTPSRIALFVTPESHSLDFDNINHETPAQQLDIPQSREVGTYPLKTAKFSNISSLTLFVPSSQGAETTRIYYLGFLGSRTAVKQQPIITVYEAQANPADHEKIRGIDGTWSTPGY